MSRFTLDSFNDDLSIHLGWDEEQSMFYMEAQNRGVPGEYILENELDDIVIQAEQYADVPEHIKESLLLEESRYYAQDAQYNLSAESELEWEEDLDLISEEYTLPQVMGKEL